MISRQDARRQLIEGLRAVADFYEANSDAYYDGMTLVLAMFVSGDNAVKALASMVRLLDECESKYTQEYLSITKNFSPKVRLELFARHAY